MYQILAIHGAVKPIYYIITMLKSARQRLPSCNGISCQVSGFSTDFTICDVIENPGCHFTTKKFITT